MQVLALSKEQLFLYHSLLFLPARAEKTRTVDGTFFFPRRSDVHGKYATGRISQPIQINEQLGDIFSNGSLCSHQTELVV
jgi:hypothetical protein